MTSGTTTSLGLAMMAAAMLVACGDDTGGGTGGGGGSGGSSTTTTSSGGGEGGTGGSTTTSTTTSTTGAGGAPEGVPTQIECVTACEAAKTGNCTLVTGDCTSCCQAMLQLVQNACANEVGAYFTCVESGTPTVCDVNCTTQEDSLTSCGFDYCGANITNPACLTLAGCFNAN